MAAPEVVIQIQPLKLVKNESHVSHEHTLGKFADRHSLSPPVCLLWPVRLEFCLMAIRENCNQRIGRVIRRDYDIAIARQVLSEAGVDRRYDAGTMFEKNYRECSLANDGGI